MKGRGRTRTILARLARAALALAAALLALYLARERVVAPLALRWIEARAARAGFDLSVRRIGGDWIDVVEVEGLRLAARGESGELRELAVARASVEIRLLALLSGEPRWLERIDVRGADVAIEVQRGPRPRSGAPRAPRVLPPWWPRTVASGVRVQVDLGRGRSIAIHGASAALAPGAAGAALAFDAPLARVELGERTLWLSASGEGSLRANAIAVERLAVSGDVAASIERSTLALAAGGADWDLRARALGGEIASTGGSRRGAIDARYEVEGLDLAALARALGPCEPAAVEGELTAAGEIAGTWSRPEVRASAAATGVATGRFEIASAAGELVWSARALAIERLDAGASYGALAAERTEVGLDASGWLEGMRAVRGRIALDIRDLDALRRAVARAAGEPLVRGAPAQRALAATEHAELAVVLGRDAIEIERGAVVTRGGSLAISRGRVEWSEDPARTLDDSRFDVEAAVDFDDLAALGGLVGDEPWRGELRGRFHLAGTVSAPRGALTLAGSRIAVGELELGELSIAADVDPRTLHLRSVEARGPLGELDLAGELDLERRAFDSARVRVSTRALHAVAPRALGGGTATVTAAWSGPLDAPRGEFELSARDLALADPRVPILERAEVRGRYAERRFDLAQIEVEAGCSVARAAGTLGHSGGGLPVDLVLERLSIERADLVLAAAAPILAHVDRGAGFVAGVLLRGTAGELTADVEWAEDEVRAACRGRDLDPMPLLSPLLPAGTDVSAVDADLRAVLRGRDLTLAGGVDARAIRVHPGAPPLSLHVLGSIGGGRARIDELDLRSGTRGSIGGSGEFAFDPLAPDPFPDGDVRAELTAAMPELGDLPWRELGSPVRYSGALDLTAAIAGPPGALRGSLEAHGSELERAPVDAGAGAAGRTFGPATLDLRWILADTLVLERCVIDARSQGRASIAGEVSPPHALGDLFDPDAWRAAALDLDAELTSANLQFLAAWTPVLRRVGGAASASVRLGGTLAAPEIDGQAEVSGGELRFEGAQRGIDGIAGRVRFAERRAEIEALRGEVGGGSIEARGSVDFSGAEPALDLAITGRSLSIARTDELRLRADVELAARGPWSRLALGGRLALRDSRYIRSIEVLDLLEPKRSRPRASRALFELFSFAGAPLATAELDVAIGAVEPFVIDTNRGDLALRPSSLYLRGTGHDPILVGAATCAPAKIDLPTSRLVLESGEVRWIESDPLVPRIDALLSARLAGYRVTVRVEGPYDRREVMLTSDPPASQEDLALMLATGEPPRTSLTPQGRVAAARRVAVDVGKDLFARWFARGDETVFDRFEIETGAEQTRSGSSTTDARFRLRGDALGPGHSLWLRGERDKYDAVNWGVRFVWRRP